MVKKSLFWSVTIILAMITVYILATNVILPVVTKNPLPEAVLPKAVVKATNNAKKSDKAVNSARKASDKKPGKTDNRSQDKPVEQDAVSNSREDLRNYFELKKTESLLRSRYNLSGEDSIYLVLDLVNKVARLEMKGIPLHDSDISDVWISNAIRKNHSDAFLRWISQPFVLKNAEATIERVPFLVKIAPKDTIEASKIEATPAPRRTGDVYIVMNFDRNLQLIIQQSEISEGEDKMRIDSLKTSLFNREAGKSIKALSAFKREIVMPKIVVTMSKTDAITLYRALPKKPRLVLKM